MHTFNMESAAECKMWKITWRCVTQQGAYAQKVQACNFISAYYDNGMTEVFT